VKAIQRELEDLLQPYNGALKAGRASCRSAADLHLRLRYLFDGTTVVIRHQSFHRDCNTTS